MRLIKLLLLCILAILIFLLVTIINIVTLPLMALFGILEKFFNAINEIALDIGQYNVKFTREIVENMFKKDSKNDNP